MQGRSDDEAATDDELILGRTAARHMIAGYAMAVFEMLPSASELDDIEDELFRFARVVEATTALRSALTTAAFPWLCAAGLSPISTTAPTVPPCASSTKRCGPHSDLVATLDWLVVQAAQARGWRVARWRTAREIDAGEREQLATALERLAGAPVELQVFVDESLLGGATVQVGDLLVDATIRHRLEQLQEHLLGAEGRREEHTTDGRAVHQRDEITAALQRHVTDYTPEVSTEQVGRIVEVGDGIARVSGLPTQP